VQERVIPAILAGQAVAFQSETGSGKTLAYLLPLFQRSIYAVDVCESKLKTTIVVVAPTHELASQIKTEAQYLCGEQHRAALFIGGTPMRRQIESLRTPPLVAVGNPGRLGELIALKKLKVAALTALVLDEADRLFSPELRDETETLLKLLPKNLQIIACSATLGEKPLAALKAFAPIEVILLPGDDVLTTRIEHQALFATTRDKFDTLRRYLAAVQPSKALVFTSRTADAEDIASKLRGKHVDSACLHGAMQKQARKAAIDRFRSGTLSLLVTSDLAARGLDIPGITHIIQMDLPADSNAFVHRAGRTARFGKTGPASGVNVVIGDEYEMRRYSAFEKKLRLKVYPKVLWGGRLLAPTDVED
jgi:superfamily II DNA/RNA helicase